MTELNLENLNALIDKGRELKNLLTGTPEILEFLRIAESFNGEKISCLYQVTDWLEQAKLQKFYASVKV